MNRLSKFKNNNADELLIDGGYYILIVSQIFADGLNSEQRCGEVNAMQVPDLVKIRNDMAIRNHTASVHRSLSSLFSIYIPTNRDITIVELNPSYTEVINQITLSHEEVKELIKVRNYKHLNDWYEMYE